MVSYLDVLYSLLWGQELTTLHVLLYKIVGFFGLNINIPSTYLCIPYTSAYTSVC